MGPLMAVPPTRTRMGITDDYAHDATKSQVHLDPAGVGTHHQEPTSPFETCIDSTHPAACGQLASYTGLAVDGDCLCEARLETQRFSRERQTTREKKKPSRNCKIPGEGKGLNGG